MRRTAFGAAALTIPMLMIATSALAQSRSYYCGEESFLTIKPTTGGSFTTVVEGRRLTFKPIGKGLQFTSGQYSINMSADRKSLSLANAATFQEIGEIGCVWPLPAEVGPFQNTPADAFPNGKRDASYQAAFRGSGVKPPKPKEPEEELNAGDDAAEGLFVEEGEDAPLFSGKSGGGKVKTARSPVVVEQGEPEEDTALFADDELNAGDDAGEGLFADDDGSEGGALFADEPANGKPAKSPKVVAKKGVSVASKSLQDWDERLQDEATMSEDLGGAKPDLPMVAKSGGGVIRSGPGMEHGKIA